MWPFKRKQKPVAPLEKRSTFVADATPDSPRGFGYKTTWWAMRSTDTLAVADAIGLTNPKPCNWATGIPASYENGIYLTPPINGWTLVTGFRLPPDGDDIESECLYSLLKLSSQFHDVQLFSTHRIVGYNVWARAVDGELFRGFGYLGESGQILWDTGDDTTESELGLNFADVNELESDSEELDEFDWPNENHVMELAGEWSVSPVELDDVESSGLGLIGFDAKLVANAV